MRLAGTLLFRRTLHNCSRPWPDYTGTTQSGPTQFVKVAGVCDWAAYQSNPHSEPWEILVEERAVRYSILLRFYQRYLNDGETSRFIASVASRYTVGTLERLVVGGDTYSRRAAALALGLIGDIRCVAVLGPTLRDEDRKLRLVADDALRAISGREGTSVQRNQLELIVRSNECGTFEKSVELATDLIEGSGGSAEAYHQRSLALFQMDAIEHALEDCRQVLKQNEFHYGAMVGLGHCHLELGDLLESLFWFRRALEVFPDLEPVRVQVLRLEKAIQEL